MDLSFLDDTFYAYKYSEDDFDSGQRWNEAKIMLNNSQAFTIEFDQEIEEKKYSLFNFQTSNRGFV